MIQENNIVIHFKLFTIFNRRIT